MIIIASHVTRIVEDRASRLKSNPQRISARELFKDEEAGVAPARKA